LCKGPHKGMDEIEMGEKQEKAKIQKKEKASTKPGEGKQKGRNTVATLDKKSRKVK